MRRRVLSILAALVVLSAAITIPAGASAAPPPSPLRVINCTADGSISAVVGAPAKFTITLEFPAIDGASGLTVGQMLDLEVSMGAGSAFNLSSGYVFIKPFETDPGQPADKQQIVAGATRATFEVSAVYRGSGNDLVLTFSHRIGPTEEETKYTFSRYITSIIQPSEPPPYEPPDVPTYGPPRLTLSGNIPELAAGSRGDIGFTLTNDSGYSVRNLSVMIIEGKDEIFRPMSISGSTISIGTLNTGSSNSRGVTIPVEVFDDVKEGYYSVSLKFIMTNPSGISVDQTSSIQVFIKNPDSAVTTGKPSLALASATVDNNTPGGDGLITLTLAIANIGDGTASETRISLTGFKSSEFTLNESLVTKTLGDIVSGDRATVVYSLKVADELDSGSYPLNVNVKYKQPDGSEGSLSDVAYINIIRPSGSRSNIQLTGVSQDVTYPGSANIIRLTLTFQNKGSTSAEDVTVSLDGLSSSGFTLSGDFGERRLGSIAPGGSATTTIALYVSQGLSTGNYPLTVILKYADSGANGAQINRSETQVYIRVNRPEKEEEPDRQDDKSVPRVIISKHGLSVETVITGSPFELTVTLLNTSTSKNVKNMKVTVTDADGIFIPVAGVNSFYIAELPIGQTRDIVIVLVPKKDAETKSFPVTIRLDYEDSKDTAYNVTESLSIPVYQPQRFEIINPMFYEDGRGNGVLQFQFVNKGRAALYNMNIRIEGDMSPMEGDYFFGTLNAGQADYYEDTMRMSMFGEVEGYIIIEYEDSAGTQQELRQKVTGFVNEPYVPDPGGIMPPFDPGFPGGDFFPGGEEKSGGFLTGWKLWAVIGGAVLIVLIVTIVIVKRAKRKKAELADYE